jgi:hypothetical protein
MFGFPQIAIKGRFDLLLRNDLSLSICWSFSVGIRDKTRVEYRAVIKTLIARRKALGLTQVDVAKTWGTDQSHISKFERFERQLDIVDFMNFCRVLQLDPCRVLKDSFQVP